jgi:hypothetical protein
VVKVTYPGDVELVEFKCASCNGNTVLKSDGPNPLLVNAIGSYSGTRWLAVRDNAEASQLTVKATGSWSVKVGGLDLAKSAHGTVKGHGDGVVLEQANADAAKIENHGGSGNFVVKAASPSSGLDLVVNTIGGYSGTDQVDMPALIEITSSGDWAITPKS